MDILAIQSVIVYSVRVLQYNVTNTMLSGFGGGFKGEAYGLQYKLA